VGADYYRTDISIVGAAGTLYRAMDTFLADKDSSYGFVDGASPGVIIHPGDPGYAGTLIRTTKLVPITGGSSYLEGYYDGMWQLVGGAGGLGAAFPNFSDDTAFEDSGIGLSWSFTGDGSVISHYTKFECATAGDGSAFLPSP
jgi:hypothetical protein